MYSDYFLITFSIHFDVICKKIYPILYEHHEVY